MEKVKVKRERKTWGFSGRLRYEDKKRLDTILQKKDISLPFFIVQSIKLYKVLDEWGSSEVHFEDKLDYLKKILDNEDIVKYVAGRV
jgi:hypothetical protein